MSEREEIFRQLLEKHQASEYVLPPLGSDQNYLSKLIGPYLEKAKEWISSVLELFLPDTKSRIDSEYFEIVFWIFVFVVGLAIAVSLLNLLLKMGSNFKVGTDLEFAVAEPKISRLESDLQRAMSQGAWAEALRLRWNLFLGRVGRADNTTPIEYFTTEVPDPINLSALYGAMFGSLRTDDTFYQGFNLKLSAIEATE